MPRAPASAAAVDAAPPPGIGGTVLEEKRRDAARRGALGAGAAMPAVGTAVPTRAAPADAQAAAPSPWMVAHACHGGTPAARDTAPAAGADSGGKDGGAATAGALSLVQAYGAGSDDDDDGGGFDDGDTAERAAQPEGAVAPALPTGWEQHLDDQTGQPYYYNAATGASEWELPAAEGGEGERLARAGGTGENTRVQVDDVEAIEAANGTASGAAAGAGSDAPAPAAAPDPAFASLREAVALGEAALQSDAAAALAPMAAAVPPAVRLAIELEMRVADWRGEPRGRAVADRVPVRARSRARRWALLNYLTRRRARARSPRNVRG